MSNINIIILLQLNFLNLLVKQLLDGELVHILTYFCFSKFFFESQVNSVTVMGNTQELILKYSYLQNDHSLQRYRVRFLLIKQFTCDLSRWGLGLVVTVTCNSPRIVCSFWNHLMLCWGNYPIMKCKFISHSLRFK